MWHDALSTRGKHGTRDPTWYGTLYATWLYRRSQEIKWCAIGRFVSSSFARVQAAGTADRVAHSFSVSSHLLLFLASSSIHLQLVLAARRGRCHAIFTRKKVEHNRMNDFRKKAYLFFLRERRFILRNRFFFLSSEILSMVKKKKYVHIHTRAWMYNS